MLRRFAKLLGGKGRKKGKRRARKARRPAMPAFLKRLPRGALPLAGAALLGGVLLGALFTPARIHKSRPASNMMATAAPALQQKPTAAPAATTLPPARPPVASEASAAPSAPASLPPAAAAIPGAMSGEPAWRQYALAVPETEGKPVIAIVIDDMGLDKANAARVIALPGPLTIAFMSYASDLDGQARAARAAGDELWLHVPMEPLNGALDAGPHVLKTELSPDENRQRLDWALSRLSGYVGINNHEGSRFTQSEPDMALVMEDLKARGLAFLDSRTTKDTVAAHVAGQFGVPHIDRNVFIDNDETVEAVKVKLAETEAYALRHGFALAIGHPHPTTIEALSEWLPGLRARGIVLVPASALLKLEVQGAG